MVAIEKTEVIVDYRGDLRLRGEKEKKGLRRRERGEGARRWRELVKKETSTEKGQERKYLRRLWTA